MFSGYAGGASRLCRNVLPVAPPSAFPPWSAESLGSFYFMMVTALETPRLQEHSDKRPYRGRVNGVWIMCFGGTVGLGNPRAGTAVPSTPKRAPGHRGCCW